MPLRAAAAAVRWAFPLLLIALASCAGTVNTVCRTEITLQERDHLMLAPVRINGTTVMGILDTGAQTSAVTDALVARLGLLGDPRNGTLMSGVGGEGVAQSDAVVDRFDLAGFDPGTGHYPVISLPISDPPESTDAAPLGALIGADLLSHFDLDLDVANHRLVLYDPDRCQGPLPDWTVPATAVPLDTLWSGRLQLPVRIDAREMQALLDSGATMSVLDLPAAEKLGVTPEMLAREKGGEGFGAAGVNFRRVPYTFRTLEVGGERITAPRISVLDRSLRETDMLLGLDWLRLHHVWISYHRHILFIAQPVGVG